MAWLTVIFLPSFALAEHGATPVKLNIKPNTPVSMMHPAGTWAFYMDLPNEYVRTLINDQDEQDYLVNRMTHEWQRQLPPGHRAVPGSRWLVEVADDYLFAADQTRIRLSRPAEQIA